MYAIRSYYGVILQHEAVGGRDRPPTLERQIGDCGRQRSLVGRAGRVQVDAAGSGRPRSVGLLEWVVPDQGIDPVVEE